MRRFIAFKVNKNTVDNKTEYSVLFDMTCEKSDEAATSLWGKIDEKLLNAQYSPDSVKMFVNSHGFCDNSYCKYGTKYEIITYVLIDYNYASLESHYEYWKNVATKMIRENKINQLIC